MRNHYTAPPVPSGLILDTQVAIIEPEETTNLILNPSFERGTNDWIFAGEQVAATTSDHQAFGAQSLWFEAIAGSATATTASSVVTNGTQYSISAYVTLNRQTTAPYYADVVNADNFRFQQGATVLDGAEYQYVGLGWYRVTLTWTATATTTVALRVIGPATDDFYIDGVQLEEKPYATTYCDGDQIGMGGNDVLPYRWTGQQHNSTSIRSATTRSGGRPIWLADLGVALLAITGLGMPGVQHTTLPFAIVDGGSYQRSRRPERSFSLAVQFQGRTETELRRQRGTLYRLLTHDLTGEDQLLRLYLRQSDDHGVLLQTDVIYGGGLEQSHTNEHLENANIQLIAPRPGLQSVVGLGAVETGRATITNNGGRIWERAANGTWAQIADHTVFNNTIRQLVYSTPRQDMLYAVGDFTAPGTLIASWDGSSWSDPWSAFSLTSGSIRQITFDGGGRIYVGGNYLMASGRTVICRWDPDNPGVLTQLGTPPFEAFALIADLEFGPDSLLYMSGNSLLASPNLSGVMAVNIGTNTISAVGNAFPTTSIVVFAADEIYSVTLAPFDDIFKWDGATWNVVVSNVGNNILQKTADTTMIVANQVASPETFSRFNTLTVSEIGEVDAAANNTRVAAYDLSRDILYVCGDFTEINGVVCPGPVAQYRGGGWLPLDCDFDAGGVTDIDYVAIADDGRIAIAADANPSVGLYTYAFGNVFTLYNPGDLSTSLIIRIVNNDSSSGSQVFQIRNVDTDQGVWFADLTLLPNEQALLTTDPTRVAFTSNTRPGTLLGTIAPGSNITALQLKPGTNRISVFAESDVNFEFAYQPRYSSIDAGTQ